MIKDLRVKVATAVLAGVLSLIATAAVAAGPGAQEVRYACNPVQRLVVTRTPDSASVQFIDRTYELRRTPSSIGEKYASNKATLIIDGPSAVFVAEERFQLGTCLDVTKA